MKQEGNWYKFAAYGDTVYDYAARAKSEAELREKLGSYPSIPDDAILLSSDTVEGLNEYREDDEENVEIEAVEPGSWDAEQIEMFFAQIHAHKLLDAARGVIGAWETSGLSEAVRGMAAIIRAIDAQEAEVA